MPTFSPSRLLRAFEGRALLEAASLFPALPFLTWAPQGDGHPVLVFPGLFAGDHSTQTLRRFLHSRGYQVSGWRLGRNIGPTPDSVKGLIQRFARIRAQHERKVSLIGWSLGGMYARELARHFPEDVRQVITLGTPFRVSDALSVSLLIQQYLDPGHMSDKKTTWEYLSRPLDVPTTSIYSRSDGVVPWRSCLEEEGPGRENVEVCSSHLGMGYHPAVLLHLAFRLARSEKREPRFMS